MFRENGNCGYVLKPIYMRNLKFDPNPPVYVHIHAISGQQLPQAANPYLMISSHGVGKEGQEFRTKTIRGNGFNPIWDEVSRESERTRATIFVAYCEGPHWLSIT